MQVQYVNQPKPGKKLGNVKTTDGRTFFFDPAEFMFTVGATYEIETKPLPFGQNMLMITKVKSNAAPQAPATPSAAGSSLPTPAGAAPRYAEPSDNIAPWYWPSVSNVCSAAIAHGLITKPEDLNMWALKWAQVAVATKEQVK